MGCCRTLLLFAPAVLAGWHEDVLLVTNPATNVTRFHEIVGPIASLVNQSYTGSEGCTYYDPNHSRYLPASWRESMRVDPAATGGMRVFFFENDKPPSDPEYRGVVAFRGTDLGPGDTVSVRADACADALLAGAPLPTDCSDFAPEVLDYYSSALSFVRSRVLAARSGADILFSGHSLGALLAALVVAALTDDGAPTPPALVFSSPGFDAVAIRKGLDPTRIAPRVLAVLADDNDPVYHDAVGNISEGAPCLFDTGDDAACDRCFQGSGRTGADCEACFLRHHIFGHYLALVATPCTPQGG